MDDEELAQLLADMESDRVERKASPADKDKICEAVCAFENDLPNHRKPGVVFVGVHDNGTDARLAITDELLRNLAGIRSDGNILPLPSLDVQKRRLHEMDLAVVVVHPSEAPPVRYRGRVWVRIGPRRAVASAGEERRLAEKRRAGDLPFDLWPLRSASLDDLDLDMFEEDYLKAALPSDVLAENERTVEQRLVSARFLTVDGIPTVTGVLTVGQDPTRFVPGAYVQFLRFDGVDLTDPIRDQEALSGPLLHVLRELETLIRINVSVATDVVSQPVEIRTPDYPVPALEQLIRNAIMHRAYDVTNAPVRVSWFNDRVEIQNPGGPYGQVDVDNFGEPGVTDYRNPTLAEVMKTLGYVQRFGVGIQLARRALERNGNRPLEFVVNPRNVAAIVRGRG
ncbi:MAG: ATP-binding protein [Egibacteraceae bacterium]